MAVTFGRRAPVVNDRGLYWARRRWAMKSMVMLMVAAVIVGGALCVPAGAQSQIPTRTVNPGYPSNFDPRFGSISSRPTFELPERVNPAFRAQPIIIAPGAQTPVTVP